MNRMPRVGDRVILNEEGLRTVRISTVEGIRKAVEGMTVIEVDPVSMTEPEPTWWLRVDHEEVNAYLLDHTMFDLIEKLDSAADPALPTKAPQPGSADKPSSDASGQW